MFDSSKSPQPPTDATARFSNRVNDYAKTRPGYPAEVLALLGARCGLGPQSFVADVGAGTGIFTGALLKAGAGVVHAVEPNVPMHNALLATLGGDIRLRTHMRTAEDTGLSAHSFDLITVAQAFHWFDRERARREFRRILKPAGWIALIWNSRREDTSPFLVAYEQLLRRWSTDYRAVNHRNLGVDGLAPFFAPAPLERHLFPSHQWFDFEGLRGRLLSSSYAPVSGHPNHEPMLDELRRIFAAHAQEGRVKFEYETEVYLGQFAR